MPAAEEKKLKLALLGCGRIAQVHWRGLAESAGHSIHVSACIDIFLPRAEEMAAKLSAATGEPCAAFGSLAEAAASPAAEFEAVDIMLLHHQHEAAALEAFALGLHVLLEKPMSITPESCAKIVAAANAASADRPGGKKVFWIAEQEQYAPAVLTAQRLIREGLIGETVTLHTMGAAGGQRHAPRGGGGGQGAVLAAAGMPSYSAVLPGEELVRSGAKLARSWRADKALAGGGVIIDGGSHTIRPMRLLMQPHCGEVEAVAAVTEAFNPESEGENFTRTMMRFQNGQVATLEMGGVPGAVYGPEPWRHRVLGTLGEVRVLADSAAGHVEPDVVLFNADHPDGKISRRRDCYFADTPSPSLLKRLLKGEGGAE